MYFCLRQNVHFRQEKSCGVFIKLHVLPKIFISNFWLIILKLIWRFTIVSYPEKETKNFQQLHRDNRSEVIVEKHISSFQSLPEATVGHFTLSSTEITKNQLPTNVAAFAVVHFVELTFASCLRLCNVVVAAEEFSLKSTVFSNVNFLPFL